MRYIRVEDSIAVEEGRFDSVEGRFHPSLKWIASETANISDRWDGQVFIKVTRTPSPEEIRLAEVDSAIVSDSTVATLKAMTNAEFSAWFAANVTTLAQARNVLERLARIVIRRVL